VIAHQSSFGGHHRPNLVPEAALQRRGAGGLPAEQEIGMPGAVIGGYSGDAASHVRSPASPG
jgi:hypothetical protein